MLLTGSALAQEPAAPVSEPPAAAPVAPPPVTAAPGVTAPPAVESGDYEIDYEEEPGADPEGDAEPTTTPKKAGRRSSPIATGPVDRNIPSSQGTRSKNKFAPMLKSDTKSIYKKNGRPLDVDTD